MFNPRIGLISLSVALSMGLGFPLHGQAEVHPPSETPPCSPHLCDHQLTQLQKGNDRHPGSSYQLGQYYTCQSQSQKAIAAFQDAIAQDPKFAHAYLALGQLYADQQQWEQAIAAYERVIELDEDLGEVYPRLAEAFRQQNRPQEAQATLDKALPLLINQTFDARYSDAGYVEAQPYFQEGQQLLAQRKFDRAEPLLRKAVSLNPSNADAALALSEVLVERKQLDAAINVVEQTYQYVLRRLDYEPSSSSFGTPYLSHSLMAQHFVAKGDLDTAIAVLKTMQPLIEQAYQSEFSPNPTDSQAIKLQSLKLFRGLLPSQIGTLLAQQGQPDAALAEFRTAIQMTDAPLSASDLLNLIAEAATGNVPSTSRPDTEQSINAKAHQYLGDVYLAQNLSRQALAAYRAGLDIDPKNSRLHSSVGFSQLKNLQIPEAIASYEQAVIHQRQATPQSSESASPTSEAIRHAALELMRLQHFEQAIQLLKSELAQSPKTDEKRPYQGALARAYQLTEQYDLAEQLIQQILRDAPPEEIYLLHNELAALQIQQQKYPEAEQAAQAMIDQFPERAMGYLTLAQVYGHQNQPELAVSSYLKRSHASSAPPRSEKPKEREIQAYLLLASQLKAQGNDSAALELYRQLSEVTQKAERPETYAIAQFSMADLYTAQQQYDLAISHLNNIPDKLQDPSQSWPFQTGMEMLLGKIYTQRGEYQKAIAAFRQSRGLADVISSLLGTYPNVSEDVLVYTSLGHELMNLDRTDLALKVINLAIQLNPEAPVPLQLRGQIYETQGRSTEAMQDYQNAIAAIPSSFKHRSGLSFNLIHPSLSNLYTRWGHILLTQNKAGDAKNKLEKAIQANDNNQEAKKLLKQAIAQLNPQ